MSEVLTFPKKSQDHKPRTPEEALEKALELLRSGETIADQMIIAWSEETPERVVQNYLLGGNQPLTSAIGLLEMTKSYLLADE